MFTFTKTNNGTKLSLSVDREATLSELLNEFESFLRASGIEFDGTIEVVQDVETDPFDEE